MIRSAMIAASVLMLAGCGQEPNASVADRMLPDHAPLEATGVTSILNAGVTARLGVQSEPVKFLFDPLYDEHFGTLEPLDAALIERIIAGAAPYDNVDAVFVSHAHGDHFSPAAFNRMMAAQSELQIIAPVQAIEQMRSDAGWDPVFAARITEISLENGEQAEAFTIAGANVEAFRSPHTGWPDRHADVHNITYRVSASTGAAAYQRIMHFGDADPARSHMGPHGAFLSSARSGLAIVPYWHFGTANSDRLIDETFNAESAVGMHVPVSVPEWLAKTDRAYFTEEGQVADVPETE
ncbi:MBL fold metallo-hydrolase [Erythrobacter sp. F6033]|uniref:MBL fold metallo-hydrolase n=1 Tax=Erythrobacter sp. F6033 TaxID=2926401 RepID=UPI001FF1ADC0|nr:MBL fold metallo-hydrolase [Erythrobacter sp. F6033]MCK0127427.1 MBL fold metallo-hydrolase [Erythrobacter sp. F6033]